MGQVASTTEQAAPGWRLKLGIGIFVLSIIAPITGIAVVTSLGLSATMTASISGVLLASGEVLGVIAVAVMGKPGYLFIKGRVLVFLKQYGPPEVVSRVRYNVGLAVFSVPILFGWLAPYTDKLIPGFADHSLLYAIGGDILLVTSLFVLGGEFWDKVRALFVYSDKICSAKQQSSTYETA